MRKGHGTLAIVRTGSLYLLLLGVVYLVASACAVSPPSSNEGGWNGILWVDSVPSPSMSATLHLHAHVTKPDAGDTGPGQMNENGINLYFNQWISHDTINGKDYFDKYNSNYSTINSNYASGTWSLDSTFVDDGNGGAWEKTVLRVRSRSLPSPGYYQYNYRTDTLDFSH